MSGKGRPSRIAVAAVAALASLGSALGASAATQHVDTTFGRNGVQIYLPGTTFRDAESAPGNAMYVAGTTILGTRAQWRIERVLYDGSHDPSFGKDGVVMLPTPNNSAYFTGLALSDSAVYAVGSDGVRGVRINRLRTTGALDTTFGNRGTVTITIGGTQLVSVSDVLVTPTDRILVLGNLADPVTRLRTNSFVLRLLPDGRRDTAFSSDGVAIVDVTKKAISQNITQLGVDGSGRVIVGGSRIAPSGQEMVVARLTNRGTFDTTFSGDGVLAVQPRRDAVSAFASVNVRADGSVVLGGWTRTGGNAAPSTAAVAAVVTPAGRLDTRFSGDGLALVATATNSSQVPTDLVVLPSGAMLISTSPVGLANQPALVIGLTPAGKLDAKMGNNGFVKVLFDPNQRSWTNLMVLGDDGSTLSVVGGTALGTGTPRGAIARFTIG